MHRGWWSIGFLSFCLLGMSLASAAEPTAAEPKKKPRFPEPPDDTGVVVVPAEWKSVPVQPLTASGLDALLAAKQKEDRLTPSPRTTDEQFLRRVYLDLTGKLPPTAELEEFARSQDAAKRARVIDRLLAAEDFSHRLACNWRDVMTARATAKNLFIVFPRQIALEHWLFEQFQAKRSWGDIARTLLTIEGTLKQEDRKENGELGFLLCHIKDEGQVERANDTARVFLGINIQCAQCHDAPNDVWKRKQFHELAAFFGRLDEEIKNRTPGKGTNFITQLIAKPDGEYAMPDAEDVTRTTPTAPRFFVSGQAPQPGASDKDRREALADYVTAEDNYYFSAAFVNRVWGDLMGQAFCMPVDGLGPLQQTVYPDVLLRLAASFRATKYDIRELYRTILNTDVYQREFRLGESTGEHLRFTGSYPSRLRAEPVLDSLICALGPIDKKKPLPGAPKIAGRYTAPLEYTFKELFGFDTSVDPDEIEGSVPQALMLMNNEVINDLIKATGNTPLAQILKEHTQDERAIDKVYLRVLGRKPTPRELQTCLDHVANVGQREKAFEDVVWSLINSTEFRMRR